MPLKLRHATGPTLALALTLAFSIAAPAVAETIIQQCGQQYQAAKAANTLNGMTWNQFRADCSIRLKATPAVAPATPPAVAPAVVAAPVVAAPVVVAPAPMAPANPLKPAVAKAPPPAPAPTVAAVPPAPAPSVEPATPAADGKPMSPGRAAFVARERQCGAEWRASKTTLIAQTPGLTWPKYFSSCNTRLKASAK